MKEENQPYSLYAFISYSHRDMAVAKWLQKRLERFRLPTEIHNDIEEGSKYLRPIFRDQSDLNTGILGDELRHNLLRSKFLILICSQSSARSEWVSAEARTFVEAGRLDRIIPVFIPDGTTPEPELFPAFLRDYFRDHPDRELLGIDMNRRGREKALIRIVSRMLGVSFDSLWKRHQRRRRALTAAGTASATAILAAAYLFAVPVEVNVTVKLQKADLPPGGAITLRVDGGEYSVRAGSKQTDRITIAGHKRFSQVHIEAESEFFNPVDTMIPTGFGLRRDIVIDMKRDNSFATFAGTVTDSDLNPLDGVRVAVAGRQTVTGADGSFSITLPLADQRAVLPITLTKPGYRTAERPDESPGNSLRFILHRQ